MEASTSSSSINWDIDDNGQADALTDGLMFLVMLLALTVILSSMV